MYFRRIEIENWAGVYDGRILLELEKDLNVVVGPNESGKSTLMNALKLAFTSKASSRRKAVRKIQPWNTELKPKIELEFRAGDKEYRLKKTFLKSSGNAEFQEHVEDGNWMTVAEDDAAHNRFLDTLDSTEGEGFFNTLWVPQGESIEIDMAQGLTERIKQAVGTTTSGAGDRILSYVVSKVGNEDNSGWLTPSTRKVASGSPWDEAKEELKSLKADLRELQEKRKNHQDNLKRIQNLRREKGRFEEKRAEKEEKLEEQQEKKDEWEEYRKVEKAAEKAKRRYNQLYGAKKDWDDRIKEIEEALKKTESIAEETSKWEEEREEAAEVEKRARNKFENRESELKRLKEKKEYLKRLRAAKINEEIDSLKEEVREIGDIDEESFSNWKKLKDEVDSTRDQLRASELKIGFEAERDLAGRISLDGEEEQIDLSSGEELRETAVKSFEIELEDIGKLSVETAMEKALEAKNEIEEHESKLTDVYETYGVESWPELEELYSKVEEKRDEIEILKNSLAEIEIQEAGTIDEAVLESFLEEIEAGFDREFIEKNQEKDQKDLSGDINELGQKIDDLGEEVEGLKEDWKDKEADLDGIEKKIGKKKQKLEVEEKGLEGLFDQLEDLKERIKEMGDRFEGVSITRQSREEFSREAEESGELYNELKEAWREARRKRDELQDKADMMKPEGEEVTEETIEKLEEAIDKLEKKVTGREMDISEIKGKIGQTADGLHEKIRDREEEIDRQKRKLESARKETRSHELLRLVLKEAKERTSSEYLEPIREKVAERLREMTKDRYTEANLDGGLSPRSAVRKLRGTEADRDDLSFGTKEQLSFLTRLAMAEVVAKNERVPVIFDDSLVNTDPERMKYMRKYLRQVSSRAQIIVFTCNGEDYWFEGDYNRIELDTLP